MAIDPVKIDHEEVAVSRFATQFTQTVKLKGYTLALMSEANNLEAALCELLELRSIDTAFGANLDIIGRLVGQPRVLINATQLSYFGFQGAAGALGFGDEDDSSIGGIFNGGESTTGLRTLTDVEYQLFIRARIAKNHSKGTIEEIISQALFLTGAVLIVLGEGDAEISLGIGKILTENEKVLIKDNDLIPKPAGVLLNILFQFDPELVFGFDGAIPNVQGFNQGQFAELL